MSSESWAYFPPCDWSFEYPQIANPNTTKSSTMYPTVYTKMYHCRSMKVSIFKSRIFVYACGIPIEQANSMIFTENAIKRIASTDMMVTG
jgi:hypothetical protein